MTNLMLHFPTRRSPSICKLLCGLALIAGSTLSGAQEPQGDTEPETQTLETVQLNAHRLKGPEIQAPDQGPENSQESAELRMVTLAADEPLFEVIARLEAYFIFDTLVAEERYEEAIPFAERIVQLIEEEVGASLQLGVALSNVAILQRRSEFYEASEKNFLRAVDVIRKADGNYSEMAIVPLIGLGVNYQVRGDYFESEIIFEEARTVCRRAHGLLNEQQIDILDHLTNTMIRMKRYAEADEHQLTALRLMERIYGAGTMEILPAIYKFAHWLRAGYRYQEERGQYRMVMDIIDKHEGATSLSMVRPLRATGNSFRIQKLREGRGISALRRALEIAENEPEPDNLLIAETLVDIGDWRVAFSQGSPTGEEYQRAWDLLGKLENGDALREGWFDEPSYVLRENPSNRGISNPNDPETLPGHVLVTFDVSEIGRTTNVTVIESVPPGLKDDSAARAINRSRFRPRLVDGELVWTQGLEWNFAFHYRPKN